LIRERNPRSTPAPLSTLVAKLIDWAYAQGYQLTAGELYRPSEQAALNAAKGSGIAHSLHTQRLAVDLQLFKDGTYLTDPRRIDR